MTNPTPPLTAERIVKELTEALNFEGPYSTEGYPLADNIETYAAQQNAELLTKCEELEAENERLKQQLAWQPIGHQHQDGSHYQMLNLETTRTYSPARYWLGVWQYWNEHTGVWERCGKKPTHARPIAPLPQPPKEVPNEL